MHLWWLRCPTHSTGYGTKNWNLVHACGSQSWEARGSRRTIASSHVGFHSGGIWFVVWILKAGLMPHARSHTAYHQFLSRCPIAFPTVASGRACRLVCDLAVAPPTMHRTRLRLRVVRTGTGRATPTVRVPNRTRRAHQRHGPFAFAPSRWRRGGTHFGGGDLGVRSVAMKFRPKDRKFETPNTARRRLVSRKGP